MNKRQTSVFISGDFTAYNRVADVIDNGDYSTLFNDILPIIRDADIAITNLESPLIEGGIPILKTGPNLQSRPKSIDALKFAGFSLLTLANNHMMDYGKEGLLSTIETCKTNSMKYVGVGKNANEAGRIEYVEIQNEERVAFINCCENEWSTTFGDYPGCNPMDIISLSYQIQDARNHSSFVILIVHGGHEGYEYPSPRMKRLYRWFIDQGVNAVIGHHTHCFSGYEIYKGKPIIYSLGNFIFDRNTKSYSPWNEGAAVLLQLQGEGVFFELFPYVQCANEVGVHLLDGEEKQAWMKKEAIKTELIRNDELLEKEFIKFVNKKERQYRRFLEPYGSKLILAAIERGILPHSIRGDKQRLYLNLIRTESHRDILLSILDK